MDDVGCAKWPLHRASCRATARGYGRQLPVYPPLIVEVFGGIASKGAQYLRFLARRASDKKRGRDGTAYSDYHASGGFLSHHLARISVAAVYWDAQHIDEGVRFLKQHARPHA